MSISYILRCSRNKLTVFESLKLRHQFEIHKCEYKEICTVKDSKTNSKSINLKSSKSTCSIYNGTQNKWPLDKTLFNKILYFFFDKLNMIDFNIFNILKLIFTYESVTYLLQNSFVNVSFKSTLSFLLVFYFDCLIEDWSVVCLLYFVLSVLDTFFFSLSLSWDNSWIDLLGSCQTSQS